MPGDYLWQDRLPTAPLKIIALPGCEKLADMVDKHIITLRQAFDRSNLTAAQQLYYTDYCPETFKLPVRCPRFGTGEAKGIIDGSCRGADIYILVDVVNHSLTYTVNGHINHMSPDDHYQNLKRIISAAISSAHRVSVVMPFLYESRQHRRTMRESLDCANMLEELMSMGVAEVITFDAHDPRIQNSVPLKGFDNFLPTYQFVKTIFNAIPIAIDKESLMIISPDEGAMDRAVYLANNLGVDMGMFYKRRDYSKVVDGRNPIVAHEFLGSNIEGKTVIIMDDMISSGDSMLDTSKELKKRGASRVVICSTFGLFTNGLAKFDEAYENGSIDYICTTNLNYRVPELLDRPWYLEADMSRYLAAIINSFNHDAPLSDALSPTTKIQKYVQNRQNDGYEYFEKIGEI